MTLHLSVAAFRAVAILFHSMGIVSTAFRLYRRCKLKHLWWDDFCASCAFLLSLVFASTIAFKDQGSVRTIRTPEERQIKIIFFWITGTIPPIIVWLSRISICLLIARIDVHHTAIRVRPWNYTLIAAFAMVGLAMFFQKIWVCTGSTAWQNNPTVMCQVGKTAGYISLVGDLLADSILTIISLRLLSKVHMRRSQKRLLSWLFAANIWSSLAGILYGVVVIKANKLGSARGLLIGMVVHMKAATTLTVCNLVVVVTYFYARFRRHADDSDSETDGDPTTRRHSNLPDGRTTKPAASSQPSTALILTELNSDGSVVPWSQQRGIASTFMTYASSGLHWLPRTPPPVFSEKDKELIQCSSVPCISLHEEDLASHALSKSMSGPPSSSSRPNPSET